jgi:hypothetical protein
MVEVIEACQQCRSPRLARVYGHCSDIDLAGRHTHGFVPRDLGIGGGDAVHFRYCRDCGQIQGAFSVPPTAIEEGRG